MKRKIALPLTFLAVSLMFSCGSDTPDETPDLMTSIDITTNPMTMETARTEYAVSDYVILCEVTGVGNSFMSGKKGEDPDRTTSGNTGKAYALHTR